MVQTDPTLDIEPILLETLERLNKALLITTPFGEVTYSNQTAIERLGITCGTNLLDENSYSCRFYQMDNENPLSFNDSVLTLVFNNQFPAPVELFFQAHSTNQTGFLRVHAWCHSKNDHPFSCCVFIFEDRDQATQSTFKMDFLRKYLMQNEDKYPDKNHLTGRRLGVLSQDHTPIDPDLIDLVSRVSFAKQAMSTVHDINNKLGVICLIASCLHQSPSLNQQDKHLLRQIVATSKKSSSLTEYTLSLARGISNKQDRSDLNKELEGLHDFLNLTICHRIELKMILGSISGTVPIHPIHLEQIVTNLVLNARDSIADSGIIRIQTASLNICQQRRNKYQNLTPGTYALLHIEDNGEGMDQKVMARLSEPFFTKKPPGKGSGIGLFTVYEIVKSAGGHIQVQSEPGKGSIFELIFPLYAT